ncbi:MAG: FAD-dependent oxidoreductase, partial [Abitibacteriaceae bacterium]|nr:FAD-dependent oxidoreductase [Abditibacteriaceae bacterium]
MPEQKRIAIIGGGPIGMEAALYGACAGLDVRLYERGRIAENVRQWGHIRFFTEWKRNRSPLASRLLTERGFELPDGETTSSGNELADYVLRLTTLEPLRGRIYPQTEVLRLTRERCLKSDFINDPRRADFPFRLLLGGAFQEKVHHADVVLDATGVYGTPNWLGNGGAPCIGEIANQKRIDYHLPDVLGRERARFANRHTLVVGSGHSAAGTLLAIADLFEEFPETRITWAVRREVPPHGYPYTLVPDDPNPNRDALHRRANELTERHNVDFHPRTVVDAIA